MFRLPKWSLEIKTLNAPASTARTKLRHFETFWLLKFEPQCLINKPCSEFKVWQWEHSDHLDRRNWKVSTPSSQLPTGNLPTAALSTAIVPKATLPMRPPRDLVEVERLFNRTFLFFKWVIWSDRNSDISQVVTYNSLPPTEWSRTQSIDCCSGDKLQSTILLVRSPNLWLATCEVEVPAVAPMLSVPPMQFSQWFQWSYAMSRILTITQCAPDETLRFVWALFSEMISR